MERAGEGRTGGTHACWVCCAHADDPSGDPRILLVHAAASAHLNWRVGGGAARNPAINGIIH